MPCGRKPPKKVWDHPRDLKTTRPSRFQQNDPSVKKYWKNVTKELESMTYGDDKFWERSADIVEEIVGPVIYKKIKEIFDIPDKPPNYEPKSETSSLEPSSKFYKFQSTVRLSFQPDVIAGRNQVDSSFDFEESENEEEYGEEEEEENSWSSSSTESSKTQKINKEKSMVISKSFIKSDYSMKSTTKTLQSRIGSKTQTLISHSGEDLASSQDDLEVHFGGLQKKSRHRKNPYYDMLYCCKSESDMIKWNSKYKKKQFEVSASDEYSKLAEIKSKQISKDFFDWWSTIGSNEYKGEIKQPSDIEELFQIWFDEHASRSLVINNKIIPCVLPEIATKAKVPMISCPNALDRQIKWDILAEKTPAIKTAFGRSLPKQLVHLPPNNDTEKQWFKADVPEDLRTMACVWEDIMHLTSTKSFKEYLKSDFRMTLPLCFTKRAKLKKQRFVVPSDFVIGNKGSITSAQDLAFPVSELEIELKEVLDKLTNQ